MFYHILLCFLHKYDIISCVKLPIEWELINSCKIAFLLDSLLILHLRYKIERENSMSLYFTRVAIFDGKITDTAKTIRENHPNKTITSVDFLLQIAKDNHSKILNDLIDISRVDRDVFISSLEELADTFSENRFRTIIDEEHANASKKFRNASGDLLNYLSYASLLSKMSGKQVISCEEYLRSFFKNPPLEFIYFLEEEDILSSADLRRYFYELEKSQRRVDD